MKDVGRRGNFDGLSWDPGSVAFSSAKLNLWGLKGFRVQPSSAVLRHEAVTRISVKKLMGS
jgi:hypothetical protein